MNEEALKALETLNSAVKTINTNRDNHIVLIKAYEAIKKALEAVEVKSEKDAK